MSIRATSRRFWSHPAVQGEVAVFGAPDDKWGESPVAAVILNERVVSAEDLRDWLNARVEARFQKVKEVVILDDFPRSTAGKRSNASCASRTVGSREGRI